MSWLARSIANSLHLDDDADDAPDDEDGATRSGNGAAYPSPSLRHDFEDTHFEEVDLDDRSGDDINDTNVDQGIRDDIQERGVKEDLSELKETLTRQLWGVASFLAPPPPPPPPPPLPSRTGNISDRLELEQDRRESSERSRSGDEEFEEGYGGDSRDFNEVFYGSNVFEEDDGVADAVGVTEEALAFAVNIAHHPETWLDFPLTEEDDFDDFDISDEQYKHALAIERLTPRLAALRIELCPAHMSEDYFWMVYFVLLHSRLNKHDAGLLSTPQLVHARSMWMQELHKRTKPESDWFSKNTCSSKESTDSPRIDFDPSSPVYSQYILHRRLDSESTTYNDTIDAESEKNPLLSPETEFIDKSVIEEDPASEVRKELMAGGPSSYKAPHLHFDDDKDDDDDDDWLDHNSELDGYCGTIIIGDEEDISFSDLEDDLDCTMPVKPESLK